MFQVVLLLTVALGLVLTRLLALPRRALTGLRTYYPAATASGEVAKRAKKVTARRGPGGPASSSKKHDDDIDLGGAESLVVAPLTARQAVATPYFGSFENVVGGWWVSHD